MKKKIPLYRQLANEIEDQITSGVFCAGEKLPSVRNFAEVRKISVVTVLKAYQALEQRGLIHSMPKSGYYISFHKVTGALQQPIVPQEVHLSSLIRNYCWNSNAESGLLGSGLPARDIVPVNQLNRILIRELHSEDFQQLSTVQGEGYDLFRYQIVKYLFLKNMTAVKENIIITNGCTEAIYLCLHSLCNPGDQIIMQSPCSFGILRMAETMKLKVFEVRPDEKDGIDLEHLRYILEKYEIKAIYLNPNVNNPLGTVLPDHTKQMIADLANEKRVFVIEDDVMSDLCYSAEQPMPIKAFDSDGYVIYCSSFTKTLLPTYRVGWIFAERMMERIAENKRALNVGTQLLQQVALAELLETGNYARYTRKARGIYAKRTAELRHDVLSVFPEDVRVSKPEGGYLLWIRLPLGVRPSLYYQRLAEENLSVLPGSFFSPTDRYENCFRINAANYGELEHAAVIRLGEIAEELLRR